MANVEKIGPEEWEGFVKAEPASVLVLTKTDCAQCAGWSAELEAFEAPDGVRIGKMDLKTPGLIAFKKANPWLKDVDVLPYNVLYVNGEPVKKWAGGGIDRLKNRLERVLEAE